MDKNFKLDKASSCITDNGWSADFGDYHVVNNLYDFDPPTGRTLPGYQFRTMTDAITHFMQDTLATHLAADLERSEKEWRTAIGDQKFTIRTKIFPVSEKNPDIFE